MQNRADIRLLVIDNYDSFTYNLVHLLEQLDVDLEVHRNDAFDLDFVERFTHILIGPGPNLPADSGVTLDVIAKFKSKKPIMGVCLGMQALLQDAGVEITNMPRVEHGMQDQITVSGGSRIFAGLPEQMAVGRYHSWGFKSGSDLNGFQCTAVGSDDYIMAIEHPQLMLYGVQFHPESIMTENGLSMLQNWIELTA